MSRVVDAVVRLVVVAGAVVSRAVLMIAVEVSEKVFRRWRPPSSRRPEEPAAPPAAPARPQPRDDPAPFLLPVRVPEEAERLVAVWLRYVGDDRPTYRDSVVGITNELDRDLPVDALACLRRGRPAADVDHRYVEPLCALRDGNLVLPAPVEEAFLTIHDLYEEFCATYSRGSRATATPGTVPAIRRHPAPVDLPQFRYHPDPIATGSVRIGDEQCICCGESRGHVYTGPVYTSADREGPLCPWCIADGSAHERLDASFTAPDAIGGHQTLPAEVVDEIAYRTPGFTGWQESWWWSHCPGDAAEFIGPAGGAEVMRHGPATAATLREDFGGRPEWSDAEFDELIAGMDLTSGGPIAFLFRCRTCGEVGGYLDHD